MANSDKAEERKWGKWKRGDRERNGMEGIMIKNGVLTSAKNLNPFS